MNYQPWLLPARTHECWQDRAERLLASGADPNERNELGQTPLFCAILHKNRRMVEVLLAHGADVNSRDHPGGLTMLHRALLGGQEDIIKVLLTHGADINAHATSDATAYTPLHAAVWGSSAEVVEQLILAGADINARAPEGVGTPLRWADKLAEVHLMEPYTAEERADIIRERGIKALRGLEENIVEFDAFEIENSERAREIAEVLRAHGASR